MELKNYIRKPFTVEAIEITAENIEEVASFVGEVRVKDGVPFIAINRRLVPNINRANIGWYFTKLGDNYRCYSAKVFTEQFIEHEPGTGYFFDEATEDDEPAVQHTAGAHNVFSESTVDDKVILQGYIRET